MNLSVKEILQKHFQEIDDLELQNEIAQYGKIISVEENQILVDYGTVIKFIPLLFEGKLKVFKEDEKNNELFMYYIYPGQGCAVSFACFDKMSSIRAQAVEASKVLTLPLNKMEEWMMRYPNWNRFVLRVYNQRFEELLETLNEVAFHKLDERLMDYLEKNSFAMETKELHITHAQIAQELNTSREVISRLLKKLEKENRIELGRNIITLM